MIHIKVDAKNTATLSSRKVGVTLQKVGFWDTIKREEKEKPNVLSSSSFHTLIIKSFEGYDEMGDDCLVYYDVVLNIDIHTYNIGDKCSHMEIDMARGLIGFPVYKDDMESETLYYKFTFGTCEVIESPLYLTKSNLD